MYALPKDRTPIKIPGKRTRSTTKAAIAERKALNRPPGRPMKLTADKKVPGTSDSRSTAPKKLKTRSLKNIKSRRNMSHLESLPIELLEKVFFYSLNPDLARASPVISGKLSSETVYIRTVLAAFGPTWEEYHRYKRSVIDPVPSIGDSKLQSAILRCRWATLSILLKSQDIWMQRSALDATFKPITCFTSSKTKMVEGEDETSSRKTAAQRFDEDYAGFLGFLPEADLINIYNTFTDLADRVEIPSHLLLGPWTEEMVRHLYWIIKSGARIEWLTSTSGEIALLGLKKAISVGDNRVIYLLIWAGLREKLDGDILNWAVRNVGGDKAAVIKLLLSKINLSDAEEYNFQKALAEIKGKAEQESDQEQLAFVDSVANAWSGVYN